MVIHIVLPKMLENTRGSIILLLIDSVISVIYLVNIWVNKYSRCYQSVFINISASARPTNMVLMFKDTVP